MRHRLGLALGLGPLFDLGPEISDLLMKGRDILRSPLWGIIGFLCLSHRDKFGLSRVIRTLADILPRYDQVQDPIRLNGIVEDCGHPLREGGYVCMCLPCFWHLNDIPATLRAR